MWNYLKKSSGILGMNARNLNYIRPYNKKSAKKLADNKLLTKRLLKKQGIGVPKLLGRIKNRQDLETYNWEELPNSFVLKPNMGLGGEGIVVVYGKKKNNNWVKADRKEVTINDLKNHIANILEGSYSLSGAFDTAFFEERVKLHKLFKPYSYRGIPDIRVIVFNNIPIMAMLRLPTEQSGGRANLHLGGICVGIDLSTGVTTTAITRNLATQKEYLLDYFPGTRLSLSGISLPYWKQILEISVTVQQITNIGYLGIDIMIDKERGPVVSELNARPGLGIQIANLAPLKQRLKKAEGLKIKTVKRGVRVGQDLFGGEIEEDIEDITGKKVLGIFETITLKNPLTETSKILKAKIDTGAHSSSISAELAQKLGYGQIMNDLANFHELEKTSMTLDEAKGLVEKLKTKLLSKHPLLEDVSIIASSHGRTVRPKIKIIITLGGISFDSLVTIADRKELKREALIGRKDLKNFLVNPDKIKP